MKRVSMLSMIIVLITVAACKKDKPDKEPDPTTRDMLMGKWKLDKLIDETWTNDGALIDTKTETGEPGDSCIFKQNNQLFKYEDKPGGIVDEKIYQLIIYGDSLIGWNEELYMIKKLTDSALDLHQVDWDSQQNQKEVMKMYLVR